MKPFSFWNDVALCTALGAMAVISVGYFWFGVAPYWLLAPCVGQFLFMQGVHVGKWKTTRRAP